MVIFDQHQIHFNDPLSTSCLLRFQPISRADFCCSCAQNSGFLFTKVERMWYSYRPLHTKYEMLL